MSLTLLSRSCSFMFRSAKEYFYFLFFIFLLSSLSKRLTIAVALLFRLWFLSQFVNSGVGLLLKGMLLPLAVCPSHLPSLFFCCHWNSFSCSVNWMKELMLAFRETTFSLSHIATCTNTTVGSRKRMPVSCHQVQKQILFLRRSSCSVGLSFLVRLSDGWKWGHTQRRTYLLKFKEYCARLRWNAMIFFKVCVTGMRLLREEQLKWCMESSGSKEILMLAK